MPNSFIQNNGETLDNIQPAHGRIITPASRGHFASINSWCGLGWETNELEGGKNFPETKSGPCIREPSDVASSTPPKDGLIVSGGRTGERAYLIMNSLQKERYHGLSTQFQKTVYSTLYGNTHNNIKHVVM